MHTEGKGERLWGGILTGKGETRLTFQKGPSGLARHSPAGSCSSFTSAIVPVRKNRLPWVLPGARSA